MISPETFQSILLAWYDRSGRKDFPWQRPRSPYRVWVSEIMLQQTQVGTVVPYFQRFTAAFPTVEALARAELDQVLRHWAGLGYYARARNLHRAANQIVAEHDGDMPASQEALIQLPGIGRSTAGAILSLAYDRPAPILDGNVKRLWCRLHAIGNEESPSATERRLWGLSEKYLPRRRNADYTQALMDFGATLCTRTRPRCPDCPLQAHCLAYRTGRVTELPAPRPRRTKPVKSSYWLLLRDPSGRIYLQQRPPSGIWAGLWTPPHWDCPEGLKNHCHRLNLQPDRLQWLAERKHTFTHYTLRYTPALIDLEEALSLVHDRPSRWLMPTHASQLAMPTPVRRLLSDPVIT
ncbi:A/G-specific adenine glycosylase [Methylohalobius crimeensis]|uniref:A/G-specific adenine glycosylase n=1 Tax=Methylohalobius crimeensis TaxID=244365 RepID=UPI0004088399|nr:A/G-specific adenine glycosylase [Methylohalobius crimeensis]